MTNKVAHPCRHCGKPAENHCSSAGCHWWVCSAPTCKAYGSDKIRRYVRPMGKKPRKGADGKTREVLTYESHEYDD